MTSQHIVPHLNLHVTQKITILILAFHRGVLRSFGEFSPCGNWSLVHVEIALYSRKLTKSIINIYLLKNTDAIKNSMPSHSIITSLSIAAIKKIYDRWYGAGGACKGLIEAISQWCPAV